MFASSFAMGIFQFAMY